MPGIGEKAPDFTCVAQDGRRISLKDFAGKTVVLFFYPKADTPGWTVETCGFRENYDKFAAQGCVVLGASKDSVEAQKAFADKLDVKFPLLADPDGILCRAYGVERERMMVGKTSTGLARTTFVIGPDTRIRAVFEKVKPEGHPKEVLEVVSAGDDTED